MSIDSVMIPKEGSLNDLDAWVAGDLGSGYLRLYDNNHVYSADDTVSDYNEATFTGYAPITPPAFGPAFINGGGKAESDSAAATWTYTAGVGTATIFGLFITDAAGTTLLAVVPFQAPVVLSPGSPTLTRVVQMTAVSEL